ncbi:MAG: hypothetical protein FWE36_08160 [Erysipelotrichales bacterium]|nr:hypothetical protein [Erysipelotrichales bacterium]
MNRVPNPELQRLLETIDTAVFTWGIGIALLVALIVFTFVGVKVGIAFGSANSAEEKQAAKGRISNLILAIIITVSSIAIIPVMFRVVAGIFGVELWGR